MIKIELRFTILLLVLLTLVFNQISWAQNQTFTLSELSKYNGKNGAKSYVAISGKVYDVSDVSQWSGGKHFCPGALAGKDITALWKISPHYSKANYLSRFPVVGTLVAKQTKSTSPAPNRQKNLPQPGPSYPRKNLLGKPILLTIGLILGITAIWFIIRARHK